ncbi:TonB-dependent receptor [Capnocytophaga periodontitidis]|uniref:TonB-dependent receptor n=1 Tax=Capnocytophaga periodontitidis TaxID=2795027 RepID=UPI0018E1B93B|nr:TonB-dependent receptor [Capnocytophaga periodontitidis]MBI1668966.1 TonB-dependent receptor [Capnocytophaga periodontitidis]
MKKKCLLLLFLVVTTAVFAQHKYTLSGSISDASNGEKLLGVNFIVKELHTGTSTNEYGFYSITLPEGKYTIVIEYIGFGTHQETIELNKNIRRDYKLKPEAIELKGVELNAHSAPKAAVRKPEMSVATIPITTVKKLPVLVGEVDIIKTLMQMPGVSNAGEASSGFNVRGGAADQNLVLLDEATIFNASHLFGFLSVFNADAVRDMKLYKGGIPARYGGRIASVLDIYQKEGNKNKFAATGGIGVLSSRLLAEGPIVKDKASFLVGGRASYAHLFLKLSDNENSAYFYDLNTKLSYQLNQNNALYLSGYFGRDNFVLTENLTNTYGNALVNLRWNHLFTDKLFSNLSAIYSNYDYKFDFSFIDMKWTSGIENFNLKYDFKNYISEKFKLTYGVQGLYYIFKPGKIVPKTSASTIKERILEHRYAAEMGFYADVEQKLAEALTVSYGLRFSNFYSLGKRTVNVYPNDNPVGYNANRQVYYQGTAIGTKYYGSNRIIDLYSNFEPRFTMSYAFSDTKSVKASYARTAQYVHLISNTASPSPLNVWAPSDEFIKPQIADQVALGYASNVFDDKYSIEVETYYKKVQNRLDYINGANLIANEAIERVLLSGENRAYGLEVLLRKNTGRLTGWIAYTLSKSEMQTKGRTPEEIGINYGDWYNAPYDKPHDLSITATYELSPKWTFGAIFNLQSGLPANYPVGRYSYLGQTVPDYSKRNEYRLPTYHRLDLSATYTPQSDRAKRWKSEWVFGVYNVYNRKNAVSVSFRENEDTHKNEAVKLSIFGIIPSITYNFSF